MQKHKTRQYIFTKQLKLLLFVDRYVTEKLTSDYSPF